MQRSQLTTAIGNKDVTGRQQAAQSHLGIV